MRLSQEQLKIMLLTGCLAVMPACSSEDEEEAAATAGDSAGTASADELTDLNISSALNLTIPSLTGSDSSLRLQDSGSKSFEACELENLVNQGISRIESMASMFCHLEIENDQLVFGTKYSIDFIMPEGAGDDGPEDGMGIWVDNSQADAGTLIVYMCQGGSLTEKIEITGVADGAAKGSITNNGSEDGYTWAEDIVFDFGYTETGLSFVDAKSIHSDPEGGNYKQHINLRILADGVSTLAVSRGGEWQGDTFNQMGAAKHNGTYGEVLFANTHTGSWEGQEYSHEWVHRAYFDDDGYVVEATASNAFDDPDGELHVADSDVPKQLDDSFTAGTISEDDWDCAADEAITVDMTGSNGAAHNACDGDRWDWQDCYTGYEQSTEEHEIDESEQRDHDDFEDVEHDDGTAE